MLLETLLWTAVGLYVVIAFYVLAENSTGQHVLTRGIRPVLRGALEAAIWPLVLVPWRELPSWLQAQWVAAEPRYGELA